MNNLELKYYFENIEKFTYKEVFENYIYPWEVLANINNFLKEKIEDEDIKTNNAIIGKYVSIKGNYIIGSGTKISSNVTIEGPVLIGKNVTIQSGALIRPGSIIGDNCVIGHASEVKNCIVQNGAKIASLVFVGDSIIGRSTRIGSGTIIANRRFDQKNIIIKINDESVNTNLDFFGAIIGDNTRLGANVTTIPGSFIGPYTWVLPTVQVRKFIPREKRVFPISDIKMTENEKIELE